VNNNLYFDTSAWLRMFLTGRPGHQTARRMWHEADEVSSVLVTYTETLAALALTHRQGHLPPRPHARLKSAWDMVWPDLKIVDIDQDLVMHAGRLAERHALRGYDAVQLAAARRSGCGVFVSADKALNAAAQRLRLRVVDLNSHS
jgi:predicted nucleic acid-binding protein